MILHLAMTARRRARLPVQVCWGMTVHASAYRVYCTESESQNLRCCVRDLNGYQGGSSASIVLFQIYEISMCPGGLGSAAAFRPSNCAAQPRCQLQSGNPDTWLATALRFWQLVDMAMRV